MQLQLQLDKQGIRAAEFQAGLQVLLDKGFVEVSGSFIKLTDAGYAAL
jgi:hypothetical protein